MLRWFIFFMLILNLVVFAWFQFQQDYHGHDDERATVAKFDFSSVGTIELYEQDSNQEYDRVDLQQLAAVTEDRCWLVGHYPEVISARDMRIELEGRGVYSRIIEKEVDLPPVSWVYIPAFPSREEAMPVLRSLQLKGIDSFLMTEEGEYKYAISLGFFGNKESAEKIKQQRQEQGYAAEITERVRKRAAYWLAIYDIQHSDSREMHKKLNKTIKEQKNTKKMEISCKELALFETKH